ncbi:hypothetical protein SLEP1_g32368 [Rubroshorea leprosula]|uniref:Autophagy-related protein 2 n=1 Tax=Rubroshorea leprosula TaxID=152421 RepID=A0AAV5KD26_9ROSI|nr:hypothetical protein SLEP1_g32368 [Rubroshorea leprosula]
MFGGAWSNIAKSAEAVVSQWAARRLFKFLLKKKLGQFILGDIDLDQLDVQLSNGTVQLSDLALNVDYLNSKFGTAASMVIKEGSIGSLLVKMPWKGKGCEVEIDELELVLAPCMVNNLSASDENCNLNEDDKHVVHSEMEKLENDMADSAGRSMSGDVHEGVKTIAKMVKWFLTSFHIKIKKLIVAFDPYMGRAGREIDSHRNLVLRISEVECGTRISEDGDLKSEAKVESFLGISQLTNFVRFQGAVLELLHMDNVDDQSRFPCTSGTTFAEPFSGCHPSNATTPIMMGKRGGFSGNLKLSIPCKNGSLDIRKVDADVYMDPVELRFQPSTIKWFLLAWETYKDFNKGGRNHRQNLVDSVCLTSNSQLHSSMPASNVIATDKVVSFDGCFSAESSSLNKQELASEALLPGAHLIPDWVPFSVSKDHKGSTGEVDFGASVDHFFECFDGMRSFQTALGSSGMWNWTCSVFSAITAASSLASGSLNLPSEQQHVQTNLKATFAGISIILSFHDEDQNHTNEQNGYRIHGGSNVHYLGAECSDIFLLMQVCPREMRLDGTMKHIEVADYLCKQNDVCGCSDPNGSQTLLIKNLQAEVQRTLPSFSIYEEDTASDELCGLFTADFPSSKKGDVIKNMLFRTFAATHCQFVKSSSSDDNFSGTTLISLKLPPLIFWLNFCSTNLLLDLLKEVGESTEMNYQKNALSHDVCNDQCESSHGHVKRASGPHITTLSSIKTVRGDISIPNARIILCFPFKSGGDDGGYSSWNQFIALDISSPSNSESAVIQDTRQPLDRSLERRVSSIARHSLHLNIGNLDIYLVTPSHQDDSRFVSCGMQPCKFSAEGILSVSNRTGCFSVISVLWQEGPATAGSDIVYLWDPKSLHGFTSISVRCSTIVALGGRLDWLESIASFFSLPSQDLEQAVDDGLHEGHLDVPHGASFVLSLVDAALSYEPYFSSPTVSVDVLVSEAGSSNPSEGMVEPHVACLLAASSLKLSNRTAEYSKGNEYKIRVQDLGLLLRAVSEHEKLGGMYSVQHLQEIGYVKVASEALMDVVFKTNCENGLQWELECSKSQIYKNGHKGKSGISYDSDSSTSQLYSVNVDNESNCGVVGLMDEICEDAFNLDGNQTCQFESSLSQFHAPLVESFIKEACSLSFDGAETFSYADLESSETSFLQEDYIPEIIESYCLSKLRPLSELSAGGNLSQEVLKSRSIHTGNEDFGIRNCGWYRDAPLRIVENHISDASEEASLNQMLDGKFSSSDHTMIDDIAKVVGCVLLRNINVRWKMYAGSDWHVSLKNGDHSTDIHGSDRTLFLELVLSGVEFKYGIFPAGGESVSKLSLSVLDFHLSDRSRAAPWQLVLGYYNSKDHPRESSSKAFKLDLEAVRPDPLIPLEEYRLRIAFLPMLLHFHQSQLDFLRSFFGEKSLSTEQSSVSLPEPSLTVRSNNIAGHTIAEEALLPYFQKFEILPIRIRVDYSPHHVDIRALKGGRYVELINLVPLKGIELKLKHVNAVGIYGWGGVCETIIEEWLEDISQNQIHKVLRGLPTIRSLLAVGAGAAKLISEPLESYRKDQRVLKGIQRGTIAFLRSISIEAVGLGLHLAAGAHDILLQAEYLFTSSPPVSWHLESKMERNVRYNQPKDAQQGIQKAYESISDGLEKSATALVRTPLKQYQRGASARSVLATAVRGVPTAAIAPASAFAGALHTALFGMRNSLDPERKKESMEKYLGPTQPQDQN